MTALAIDTGGNIFAATGIGGGGVYRSTDVGESWNRVDSGFIIPWIGALAIDSSGAIFVGTTSGGAMYRSTNHGTNWVEADSGLAGYSVSGLAISPSGIIFAATSAGGGGIYRSTDKGTSWNPTDSGHHTDITNISINAAGEIFIATMHAGLVYRSTDNGANWIESDSGLPHWIGIHISSFAFNAINTIFAGTQDGVYRSTDNGMYWTRVSSGLTNLSVTSLAITPGGSVFAATGGGGTFRFSDSGNNWTQIISGLTDSMVYALAVDAGGTIFAGTKDSGAYRSVQPTTSVRDYTGKLPGQFLLEQNYPNPFNPTTTISYTILGQAHTRLSIFNSLGQEVRILVDKIESEGRKSVSFDAGILPSGVYFYLLRAGNFTETKKLVLMK